RLSVPQLQALPRMGERSSENLVAAITKSREIPLNRFIFALGIRHVGERTALTIAQHCRSLERFLALTAEELEAIPDVGVETARTISAFLADEDERRTVHDLLAVGV